MSLRRIIAYRFTKWHWLTLASVLGFVFLMFQPVQAQFFGADALYSVLGTIAEAAVFIFGNLLIILIEILIKIFSFSNFIDAPAVEIGWVIVRDLANITLVVALIIIAGQSVFKRSGFNIAQMLVRIIVAAILINFSRLIAGFIIDLGQVIMGTFVNAFTNIAAGNLTYGFGIQDLVSIADAGNLDFSSTLPVIGALALAILMLVVASGVILAMIVVLLQRIVMLWVLVIFSPVAYVAPLVPGGSSFAGDWWGKFSRQVFIGPALAFFFWLAMSILSNLTAEQHILALKVSSEQAFGAGSTESSENIARFASKASSPQRIVDYMVTIALLVVGLGFAKTAGGAAGSFAGTIGAKIQGGVTKVGRGLQRGTIGAAKLATVKPAAALAKKLYLPQTAKAIGQRIKTSGTGKFLGLDAEHKEKQKRKTEAAMRTKFGGQRFAGDMRAEEERLATEEYKKLSEGGAFGSKKQIKQGYQQAIKNNNKIQALAFLKASAEQKDISEADQEKFADKFGGGLSNMGDYQQRVVGEHIENLMGKQSQAGDDLAGYKSIVGRRKDGKLTSRSEDMRFGKAAVEFAEQGYEGMQKLTKATVMKHSFEDETGAMDNKVALEAFIGNLQADENGKISAAAKNNIGRIGADKHKLQREYIAGALAKADEYGLSKEKIAALKDASRYTDEEAKYFTTGELNTTADNALNDTDLSEVGVDEIEMQERKINKGRAEARRDVQEQNLEGGATGERHTDLDKRVGGTILPNVDHILMDSQLENMENRKNKIDAAEDKITLMAQSTYGLNQVNRIYKQLSDQADALDGEGVSSKQFGEIKDDDGNVVETRELEFKEVLERSRIGQIRKELGQTVTSMPAIEEKDVKDRKKHVSALFEQMQYQIEGSRELISEYDEPPSIIPGAAKRQTERRRKQQAKIRSITVNTLSQAQDSLAKLTGEGAATDKSERKSILKDVKFELNRLRKRNSAYNPDKRFTSDLGKLVNNVKKAHQEQKENTVDHQKIADIISEAKRLGEAYKGK